jgi:hypothetical protein
VTRNNIHGVNFIRLHQDHFSYSARYSARIREFIIQGGTKKRELLKNPTKIVEIKKKLLTEIEPLQLAFPLIHDY